MNINRWPKPAKTVYNENLKHAIKKDVDMQMLSMLGLSGEDITKLEVAIKAMAETPSKIDALIARIDKLERSMIDGKSNPDTGTGNEPAASGTYTELRFNERSGLRSDDSGNITKF